MNDFLFFSYLGVCLASLLLWVDAARRPEYGRRPLLLLVSLLILGATGIVLLTSMTLLGARLPIYKNQLLSVTLFLSFTAFFTLECSVHIQRIHRSFLFQYFRKRLLLLGLLSGLTAVILVLEFVIFHAAVGISFGGLFSGAESPDPERLLAYRALGNWLFVFFTAGLTASLFYSSAMFKFHEGITRRRRYPSTLFFIILAYIFIAIILDLRFANAYPFFPFTFINLLYAAAVYHEYFFYRMFHLNDLQVKLVQAESARTDIINRVIASSTEEDHQIIRETLSSYLERAQSSITVPTMRFNAVMAYRKNGDILQVDSPQMIVNYCVPLTRLESVKRIPQKELNALIMQTTYRPQELMAAEAQGLREIGERAVRDLLETRARVIVPISENLKGIFRLIVAYPVINHEEVTGFVVLFKSEFDQVFPQEDTIIKSLTSDLSIIFAIMGGKQVQLEKNRLSGEMDIARNIQTSIVPRAITIPGYQAAAGMSTATEVGGDLYDCLSSEFGTYLDISDVSGHGLPAGMMALIHLSALHGAIFTSQTLKRELAISDLYDVINKVLVSINKKRIGSDKFMTCSVLRENNGTFTHAGTHLISLLYRKESDSVEELRDMIDKTAFLGLSEYVTSRQSEGSFSMKTGDALLLYTDGAIEAKDSHGEQYGLERLKGTFKRCVEEPPEQIIKAINESVSQFAESGDIKKYGGRLADDVSLMVLKKS